MEKGEVAEKNELTEKMLLYGPMPLLKKMQRKELEEECQMWRNLWQWMDAEVRGWLVRTGSMISIIRRNYQRKVGILLDTKWTLKEVSLGVYDKEFDPVSGQYYFERKVIVLDSGQIFGHEWIHERTPEGEVVEGEEGGEMQETDVTDYDGEEFKS